METLALIVRVAGAAILVVAGAGKLADPPGSRRALASFRVPPRLVGTLAVGVPVLEIALGLGLLPEASAAVAATVAAMLFAAFAVAMAAALRRGESPNCHCFGVVHSAPVRAATVARTAALGLAAAAVAVIEWSAPGQSAVSWLGDLSAIETVAVAEGVALVAVLAGGVWLAMHLLRQNGRLMLRLDAVERATGVVPPEGARPRPSGLEVGAPAPAVTLAVRDGGERPLDRLAPRALLVFADAGCGPCRRLFTDLEDWVARLGGLHLAVVLAGDAEAADEVPAAVEVLFDPERTAQEAFAVPGTPCGILVADGRVSTRPAPGAQAIERLLEEHARPILEVHAVG